MRLIDVEHQGIPHVIGAWLVDGVLIDPGPAATVDTLLRFLQPSEHVAVLRDDVPEEAVAYDVTWVRRRAHEAGLTVKEPVHPGTWRGIGSPPAVSFQDIMILCA